MEGDDRFAEVVTEVLREANMKVTVTFTDAGWKHAANLGESFADWEILAPLKMRYKFTSKTRFANFCSRLFVLGHAATIEIS